MKLSIIVPIYNKKDCLKKCIESVLMQKFANYELILINDGSTDNSLDICKNFAEKNSNIILIDKVNSGLSDTRNVGINIAKGEYITFLDSDDFFVSSDYFTDIMQYLSCHTVDFLALPILYFFDEENKEAMKYPLNKDLLMFTKLGAYEYMILNGCFLVSACTKILKRQFVVDNNLYFEKGITAEDNEWFFRVMRCAEKIGSLPKAYYAYRQNVEGSITSTRKELGVKNMIYIIKKSLDYHKNTDDPTKKFELSFCAYLWCICKAQCNNDFSKEVLKDVEELTDILKYDLYSKVKYIRLIEHFLGSKVTGIILKQYLNKRDARSKNNAK